MIYLIHFDEPYRHARHYIGFVDTSTRDPEVALDTRMEYHRSGRGSRLLAAVARAGIGWSVVRTWADGTRSQERRLKCQASTVYCPVCNPVSAFRNGVLC